MVIGSDPTVGRREYGELLADTPGSGQADLPGRVLTVLPATWIAG
jgi:hypothetical protein